MLTVRDISRIRETKFSELSELRNRVKERAAKARAKVLLKAIDTRLNDAAARGRAYVAFYLGGTSSRAVDIAMTALQARGFHLALTEHPCHTLYIQLGALDELPIRVANRFLGDANGLPQRLSDQLSAFLTDISASIGDNTTRSHRIDNGSLYIRYSAWALQNRLEPLTPTDMARALTALGYVPWRSGATRGYYINLDVPASPPAPNEIALDTVSRPETFWGQVLKKHFELREDAELPRITLYRVLLEKERLSGSEVKAFKQYLKHCGVSEKREKIGDKRERSYVGIQLSSHNDLGGEDAA